MKKKGSGKRSRRGLVRSCEAAKILGVSREYVRQMVINKVLPPKYLFNANSWRKIYIFDRKLVVRFSDPAERKKVRWKEPEPCSWMTAVELSKIVGCDADWIYNATKKGYLEPELVIASSKQKLRLYDKEKVEEALRTSVDRRTARRGHSKKTLRLMERIKKLHAGGMNDSHIAIRTKSTQPFISKLRKELGLISNARIASAKRKAMLEAELAKKAAMGKPVKKKRKSA
ncbi:MAG: hypothetical protein LBU70_05415 [Chitinispirillales bacterium]|nr:hypothetical protein [Chitinispirillales bacterium]